MNNVSLPEGAGMPPSYVFDPRAKDESLENQPVITARFFRGPDPRPNPVGQPNVGADGTIPTLEMVEIRNLNDPKNSLIQVSTDIHRFKMFPREYAAFSQGLERASGGTPLRDWLGENDRTRDLEGFHILTVEQLASISDARVQNLGPGTYELRKRAQAYIQVKKDTGLAEKVMAENATLKDQMARMEAALARLGAVVESGQAKAGAVQEPEIHPAEQLPEQRSFEQPRRGPGRPRSHQET